MSTVTVLRVLLVEDESIVAMMVADLLEELGHVVAGAASTLEDAVVKAASLEFDVALLDLNLNGRQSKPVVAILQRRELPFVFTTGYGSAMTAELAEVPVLRKPFLIGDLQDVLQQAIKKEGR